MPSALAQLDRFTCLILDDSGYVQPDRDEMEVLFTLLAERYECRSISITTNLAFSDWNRIFKAPMTTIAAIDRVVHHSVILDMIRMERYRVKETHMHQISVLPQRSVPRNPQCSLTPYRLRNELSHIGDSASGQPCSRS